MTTETSAPAPVEPETKERHYGFSALVSGFARMWRATPSALLVIVVNAIVQGLLILPGVTVGLTWQFVGLAALSAVAILVTYAVLTAGAFESVTGRAGLGTVFGRAFRNLGRFTLWVVLQWIVIGVASAFWTLPGWVTAAILVYIPLAAVDDDASVLRDSFRAIGSHPFRWIITALIIGFLGTFVWLFAAVNSFFVAGFVASATTCLVVGLLSWWWLTAWACLYRSRKA